MVFAVTSLFSICYAQDCQLNEKLGPAVTIVTQATRIETARLKVIGAQDAQNNALRSTDRIAGYPIESTLMELKTSDEDKLVKLILDDKNCATVRQRCRNQYLLGLRFTKNKQIAEFALGMPCQQALWAFIVDDKIQYYGTVLGTETTQKVIAILQK